MQRAALAAARRASTSAATAAPAALFFDRCWQHAPKRCVLHHRERWHHSGPAWRTHAATGNNSTVWSAERLSQISRPEEVPVPLCKRPPEHAEPLEELLAWRSEVLRAIDAVGDSFESADGGPDAALLRVRGF